MFHSKRTLYFFGLIVFTSLVSCGPSSDTVKITILPSIGYHPKKFHELSKDFFGMEKFDFTVLNTSNSCRQMFVRSAITHTANNAGLDDIEAYPLNLRTFYGAVNPTFNSTWLNTDGNAEFDGPIIINSPKGLYTEVGIFGVLNSPGWSGGKSDIYPNDDVCDNLGAGGTTALQSFTIMGHTSIGTTSDNITVPLSISMYEANPSSTPLPTPAWSGNTITYANNGGWVCDLANQNDVSKCPLRDVVEIQNTGPTTAVAYCKILSVQYLFASNETTPLTNYIIDHAAYPSIKGHVYVGHIFPMVITLQNTSTMTQSTITVTNNQSSFSSTNGNLPTVCDSTQTIKIGNVGTL